MYWLINWMQNEHSLKLYWLYLKLLIIMTISIYFISSLENQLKLIFKNFISHKCRFITCFQYLGIYNVRIEFLKNARNWNKIWFHSTCIRIIITNVFSLCVVISVTGSNVQQHSFMSSIKTDLKVFDREKKHEMFVII